MEAAATAITGLLGMASAALGFVAETKRLTADDISLSGMECIYHATPAYKMGICAVTMLFAAQITVLAAAGCCGRSPGGKRSSTGAILFVMSWITMVIAAYFYLDVVMWNASQTRDPTIVGHPVVVVECPYLKGGGFVKGAVVTIVTTALGVMSGVLLRARAAPPPPPPTDAPVEGADETKRHGFAVGLPQWPAQGYGQAPYQLQHPPQV